jgi:arylsulfatase A-like enzyme
MTLLALALVACSGGSPGPSGGSGAAGGSEKAAPSPGPAPDIVLISLDTTRADALSCYGQSRPTTPNADALATSGVRFAWALAQSPSTLASHATVMTGLDPHGTRIVRNGYPLPPDMETLAERLGAAGYDTIGVIGSSALARPMGIDRGFRVWDQSFSVTRKQRHEAMANEVTDRALAAVAGREAGKPLFLFAHYYDAHSPYDAPEPFKHRYSDPQYAGMFEPVQGTLKGLASQIRTGRYDPKALDEVRSVYLGEVSWVDQEVGRLLAGLDRARTVVVVFGDHGDMFGEVSQRPFGHGADVDLPVSHVPLIVSGPGVPVGRVVETPIGLQDVPATILALVGKPAGFGGSNDLSPLWGASPPTLHRRWHLEATQPGYKGADMGWNNKINEVGVLDGRSLLTESVCFAQPPTLYEVGEGQSQSTDTARRDELAAKLEAWLAAAPPYRTVEMTDETREALKALGYTE